MTFEQVSLYEAWVARPARFAALCAAMTAMSACRSSRTSVPAPAALSVAVPTALGQPKSATTTASSGERGDTSRGREPIVLVSEPATLKVLEAAGLDLGSQLVDREAFSGADLAQHARYRVLVDTVAADLRADRSRDPSAGVGMRYTHRQFDARWLSSARLRWELIAVANRIDRRPFAPAYCGEARLIYRLAYRTQTSAGPVDSRLPMTLNLVRYQLRGRDSSCSDAARSWLGAPGASEDAAWLASARGPLSPTRVRALPLKSVELNFQGVRWPSTVRPSLGGHAEYVLRAFHPRESPPFLEPAPLENTIDTARLAQDRALRAELREWLRRPDALRALDAGTLRVPDKFLTRRAVSVSPHGLARSANRPFARAFKVEDFAGVDLSGLTSVRSGASLLRRLDGLSCPGCHQSRSLAGFHWLGEDAGVEGVDALHVPMSAHLHSEVQRRRAYVSALAQGLDPDESRPAAEAADDGVGARCGLGDPGFAGLTCGAGLRCVATDDPELGVCIPDTGPSVGDPCEYGFVSSAAAHADTARLSRTGCRSERVCEANSVGFPGGMCAGTCDGLPPGSVCGGIALLVEFNDCLARGKAFESCIRENTRPGALRACSSQDPCRDDYVCARSGEAGACMPPYFLFQLRVDGHPI